MRILLTGATGFIGVHILRSLLRDGISPAILIRENSSEWRLRDLPHDKCSSVMRLHASLQEAQRVREHLAEWRPDIVIHSAWAGVGNRFRNESLQIDDNLMSSVNLLRAAAESGCGHFVGLGSQAEYGPLNRKITEDDFASPTTLYGAAKLATGILLRSLAEQHGMRFAWVRVFSTYGPLEDPGWMIPGLIQTLLRGERPPLTAGEQKWDYLFGPDAGEAIWAIAREPRAKGVFNLGSGQVYTLRKIVETVRDMIDPKLELGFGEVPYRPDQVMHLEADISRLRSATGWSPATSLEDGLRETVAWHRQRREIAA